MNSKKGLLDQFYNLLVINEKNIYTYISMAITVKKINKTITHKTRKTNDYSVQKKCIQDLFSIHLDFFKTKFANSKLPFIGSTNWWDEKQQLLYGIVASQEDISNL